RNVTGVQTCALPIFIKDYLRFLNKDLSQIPVWQRSATPILTLPCLTPDVFRVAAQHSMMPAETESEKERTRALLFTVLSRFLDRSEERRVGNDVRSR